VNLLAGGLVALVFDGASCAHPRSFLVVVLQNHPG
jgi:hypothetical protein